MVSTFSRSSGGGDDVRTPKEVDIGSIFQDISPEDLREGVSNPGVDFLTRKKMRLSIEDSKENHADFRTAGADLHSSRNDQQPQVNTPFVKRRKKLRFSHLLLYSR